MMFISSLTPSFLFKGLAYLYTTKILNTEVIYMLVSKLDKPIRVLREPESSPRASLTASHTWFGGRKWVDFPHIRGSYRVPELEGNLERKASRYFMFKSEESEMDRCLMNV